MKSKITKEVLSKVENFFHKGYIQDTIQLSILKNEDGTYDLFDKYTIIPENNRYKIEIKYSFDTKYFSTLKNAVTWVIFHKRNHYREMGRIEELDKKIESINFSITYLKAKIQKTKDIENVMIYGAKLSQDEAVKRKLMTELNDFVHNATIWHFGSLKAKVQN